MKVLFYAVYIVQDVFIRLSNVWDHERVATGINGSLYAVDGILNDKAVTHVQTKQPGCLDEDVRMRLAADVVSPVYDVFKRNLAKWTCFERLLNPVWLVGRSQGTGNVMFIDVGN